MRDDGEDMARLKIPVYVEQLKGRIVGYHDDELKNLYAKCFCERALLILSGESRMADVIGELQDEVGKEIMRRKEVVKRTARKRKRK